MAFAGAKLELDPKDLGILVFPFLVIFVSFTLIPLAGVPLGPLAKAVVENGHAETAGRLQMLATWLLLLAVGCGCVGLFAWDLRLFKAKSFKWMLGAFTFLAAFGCLVVSWGASEGPRLIGEPAICAAFGPRNAAPAPAPKHTPAQTASANGIAAEDGASGALDGNLQDYRIAPPSRSVSDALPGFLRPPNCPDNWQVRLMWRLNLVQRLLLALVSPALVLGTIGCLAMPDKEKEEAIVQQLARLKARLYLATTLFVSGLLFLSALLRWPAFAFRGVGHDSYIAHVDAFVLYWGVTYTLYIASYYAPVALLLSSRGRDQDVPEDKLPAGQLLDWTKTLAALFAPAVVGLLGNVLRL